MFFSLSLYIYIYFVCVCTSIVLINLFTYLFSLFGVDLSIYNLVNSLYQTPVDSVALFPMPTMCRDILSTLLQFTACPKTSENRYSRGSLQKQFLLETIESSETLCQQNAHGRTVRETECDIAYNTRIYVYCFLYLIILV